MGRKKKSPEEKQEHRWLSMSLNTEKDAELIRLLDTLDNGEKSRFFKQSLLLMFSLHDTLKILDNRQPAPPEPPKKCGRPRKEAEEKPKRPRGRPRKYPLEPSTQTNDESKKENDSESGAKAD